MKIGFFDSGIGGLTVLKEALNVLPNQHFIYYGDTENIPYGEKSAEAIIEYSMNAARFLVDRGAEAIVVACNTASSAAGQTLRHNFDIPIICMEPAINLAFKENASKILVLATNLTLHLDKYLSLKERLNAPIDEVAAPKLVELAEEFRFDEVGDYLSKILAEYDLREYSHLVLGCTHFTFFRDALQSIMPPHIKIIDGNKGTIEQLIRQLPTANCQRSTEIEMHFTKENKNMREIERFLSHDIKTI